MRRVAILAFVAALALSPAAAQPMSEPQVASLLRGFSVEGRSDRLGGAGTFHFDPDGTLRIDLRAPDRSPVRGRGRHRFANGGLCATSPRLGPGERCYMLRRLNRREVAVLNPDGSVEFVLNAEMTGP